MKPANPRKDRLERVFRAAGSMSALARLLGITPQSVADWNDIPPERCLKIESLTGVSRYELRPDIYGDPPRQGQAA